MPSLVPAPDKATMRVHGSEDRGENWTPRTEPCPASCTTPTQPCALMLLSWPRDADRRLVGGRRAKTTPRGTPTAAKPPSELQVATTRTAGPPAEAPPETAPPEPPTMCGASPTGRVAKEHSRARGLLLRLGTSAT